jgi:RHS repeat-associated protein
MTFSATCATGEVLRSRSYYRAEQYDSDLGLYYLRARYYNPLTGRFLSRDPEDGVITDPASLHKYMYAGGDPVNRVDPRGRADEEEEVGIIPSIIRATVTVATNLWGTLPEYLATVEQFAGNIYLTVQDVLEAIAANRYAASAARFLACGITGTLVARLASESNLSADKKKLVIEEYLLVCSAFAIIPASHRVEGDTPLEHPGMGAAEALNLRAYQYESYLPFSPASRELAENRRLIEKLG